MYFVVTACVLPSLHYQDIQKCQTQNHAKICKDVEHELAKNIIL